MYAAYFGLKREPFSIAPDPRLLFMSEQHREALAHLLYGVQGGGGFVLLTGEIGTGKTTVCRCFLEQVPEHCNLAYVFNPKLSALELLETVCHEFGLQVDPPAGRASTVKDFVDALNRFLLAAHAQGRNNVLVIDEAQNLAADVLEQLRLLTNLETSERKLLQVILIGQPELRGMLARPELEQLAQRVIARYHLRALDRAETEAYVRHRLDACGLDRPVPFDRRALARIHRLAGGVPRRINLLCDRALLGAFAHGEPVVTRRIIDRAAAEVFAGPEAAPRRVGPRLAVASGIGLLAGAALIIGLQRLQPEAIPAAARPAAVAPRTVASAVPATVVRTAAAAPAAVAASVAASAPASTPAPAPAAARPFRPLRDAEEAWRELAGFWDATVAPGDACATLARSQLQCFSRKLTLATIRQMGRPGILTLEDDGGRPSHVLLVGLNDTTATLRAGGVEQVIALDELAARWRGEFATLWRTPPGHADAADRNAAGALQMQWASRQLAALRSTQAPTGEAAQREQLRAFQRSQGLPADGRPGPLTFMQLNRAAGVAEPRLRTGI